MIDKVRLAKTLMGVCAYYGREFNEFVANIWADDLAGFDMDAIDAAFVRHRRDPERGRFMPYTADILKQLQGGSEESALVAWGKVLQAARSGGGVPLSESIRDTLATMGGLSRIRLANESENGFLQREFCSAFKTLQAREQRQELASPEVSKLVRYVVPGKAEA